MSRYQGTGRAAIARQTTYIDAMAREMTERRSMAYRRWVASITAEKVRAGRCYWVEDEAGETIRLEPVGKKQVNAVKGSSIVAKGMPMAKRLLLGLNKPAGPDKYGDYTQAELDGKRI